MLLLHVEDDEPYPHALFEATDSTGCFAVFPCELSGKTLPWKPVVRALTLAVLAQSLATLRCCSMTRDVIILADIFEEEDFYPSTFGFRLSPPVDDDSVIDLIDLATAAMEDRVSAIRSCKFDYLV